MIHSIWKNVLSFMPFDDAILARTHLRFCCRGTASGAVHEISLACGFLWYVCSDEPLPEIAFHPDQDSDDDDDPSDDERYKVSFCETEEDIMRVARQMFAMDVPLDPLQQALAGVRQDGCARGETLICELEDVDICTRALGFTRDPPDQWVERVPRRIQRLPAVGMT